MFYKTILRRNTKNGPKLKVASVLEETFPRPIFPPSPPVIFRRLWPFASSNPADRSACVKQNRLSVGQNIRKKRNQSTNKEQQITATAQIPSIATKNKFSYNNNNKERKKRSEAEFDSRGDFQHRISPVRFSGGARRTRNEIFYQKQKSRWGLVSVSWWGGPRSIGNYAKMGFLMVGRLRFDYGKFVRCFLYIDISV